MLARCTPVRFFFLPMRPPPRSTLFPYTTLFRSVQTADSAEMERQQTLDLANYLNSNFEIERLLDRKSTRLNTSHMSISYAVFCLKKKRWLPRCVTRCHG